MATHSSVLAWRIPGTGEPGGLPSMRSHRVGHDWSDLAAAAFCRWSLKSINSSWLCLILFISRYNWGAFGFGEGDSRGVVSLSPHQIKGTCHLLPTWLLTAGVNLHPLAQAVFARILPRTFSPLLLFSISWKQVTQCSPHWTSWRGEYLYKLFRILLCGKSVSSSPFI